MADYVTDFVLPPSFRGCRVNISFQGVESGFACWLNGQYLGYSEDSFTPSDFSLDAALREGRNRLAVRVFKWTPGSWFEDQDFYRFSGIFRSVWLYALPGTALLDLSVVPVLSEDFSVGTAEVTAKLQGAGSRWAWAGTTAGAPGPIRNTCSPGGRTFASASASAAYEQKHGDVKHVFHIPVFFFRPSFPFCPLPPRSPVKSFPRRRREIDPGSSFLSCARGRNAVK